VSPRLGLRHTHTAKIPILLQVQQAKGGDLDNNSIEQLTSFNNDEMNTNGGRYVNESKLTLTWIKKNNNNSRRSWSVSKMFLLRTKVN
jgi:hypothetical protein